MCWQVSFSFLIISTAFIAESIPMPERPAFISQDIVNYLSSSECLLAKENLDQILKSVGIERNATGLSAKTICYRPYPKNEKNVETDTLGSFCALSFETIQALCKTQMPPGPPTRTVPVVSSLSETDVCSVLSEWVQQGHFPPVTKAQYGEQCNHTCSELPNKETSSKVNQQCYDLYYGRMLLSFASASPMKDLVKPSGSDSLNKLMHSSSQGTTSAASRQSAVTEVSRVAAVVSPGPVVDGMPKNTSMEGNSSTESDGSLIGGSHTSDKDLSGAGIPSSGDSQSPPLPPVLPPRPNGAPSVPQSAGIPATGMSPGVIISSGPKLPPYPSGPAAAAGDKGQLAPGMVADLSSIDNGGMAVNEPGKAGDVSGARQAEPGAVSVSGGSVASSGSGAASGVGGPVVGPVATSSSRRPPVRADEMPPPPVAAAADASSSSSSSPSPPAGPAAVPPADTAIAAPAGGDVDPGKLPEGQEIIADTQDVDYEDPSMRFEADKNRPALAPRDDSDFSLEEPQQLYKAPSGLQPMDDPAGVSAFKPLREQGGSQSNFFAYFLTVVVLMVVLYLVFHNKKKIMALIIEGRQSGGRRRPHSSQYRKLDSSLEEAVTSQQRQQIASNIIY